MDRYGKFWSQLGGIVLPENSRDAMLNLQEELRWNGVVAGLLRMAVERRLSSVG